MPCTRTSRLMLKSRLIHLLHSCSAEADRAVADVDRSPTSPARFQWIVSGTRTSSRASSSAICHLVGFAIAASSRAPRAAAGGRSGSAGRRARSARRRRRRPGASGCRRTRCCLLRSGSDRCRSSRTCPSCRGCRAAAGPTSISPFGDVFRRKGDRHGQHARAHAGVARRDPERRAAADRGDLRLARSGCS